MSNLWHVTKICALGALSEFSSVAWSTPLCPQYMGMLVPKDPLGNSQVSWEISREHVGIQVFCLSYPDSVAPGHLVELV